MITIAADKDSIYIGDNLLKIKFPANLIYVHRRALFHTRKCQNVLEYCHINVAIRSWT